MQTKGALFDPLIDPKYSENSNIVKYCYNSKYYILF